MPYIIRKGKGDKPFKIVNKATGEVVGSSTSTVLARRSIVHREGAISKNIKDYKRTVDNKMQGYGETDLKNHTIKINKSKKKNAPGEILDSIVHEKQHILHHRMSEKRVQKETAKKIYKMSSKDKQKHYRLFNS